MGRREDKREATRQEILNAAAELFRTKGYDSTSVDDIVVAANLAKGTFYYHFQKKEDLVLALQESQLKEGATIARNALANGESPRTVLFDYLAKVATWTEDNSELSRALFRHKFEKMKNHNQCPDGEDHGPPPSIKTYFIDLMIEIIEAAQKAGELRSDMKAAEIVQVVVPVVMSARMSWLMGGHGSEAGDESETLSAIMERAMRVLLDGLVPRS
ncbi:MAG: TetR/AcrR family transcriptional regulator [Cyanobacteria bacterium SZAS LIN-3]|nr:TetR/AcrR family transcriptional regulator [Cyanobacteria bacterium SZAS LIN-3]